MTVHIVLLISSLLVSASSSDIYSVVGGSAELPCSLRGDVDSDEARLVLWYKDNEPRPVYSYDARFSTVKHWSEDPEFGPRAFFKPPIRVGNDSSMGHLIVSGVRMKDAGVYRCRVDFRHSRTSRQQVRLRIMAEPDTPVILDEEGSAVMGAVGPFNLGQPLILVCLVEGGRPRPRVEWYMDGDLFDADSDPSTYEDVLQNTLVVSALDRDFHNAKMECRAINNNVTTPPTSSVKVQLELPLLDVRLTNLPDPVTANEEYEAVCQAVGAEPPATVAWTLDNQRLNSTSTSLSPNMTTSRLRFTPRITDQGRQLKCTATNEVFPAREVQRLLNVYYVPVVHVEAEVQEVNEGDDLVLSCRIKAHPWVWQVLWFRDGLQIHPDGSKKKANKMDTANTQLVLRHVSKMDSGMYVCSASNVEGDGFSTPVSVAINFRPVCRLSNVTEVKEGIALGCDTDARPAATSYRWLFNSSETNFEIPSGKSVMRFNNYKVSDDFGQGHVLCFASNAIGEQSQPCVFGVVPLGTPEPVSGCKVKDRGSASLTVSCSSGFGGGLEQHFVMEVLSVLSNGSQVSVASAWSTNPEHLVAHNLVPDSDYIVSVKAVNDRGESPAVFLGTKTSHAMDPDSAMNNFLTQRSDHRLRLPTLYVIVSALVLLMILAAVVTACLAVRQRAITEKTLAANASLSVVEESRHNDTTLLTENKRASHMFSKADKDTKEVAREYTELQPLKRRSQSVVLRQRDRHRPCNCNNNNNSNTEGLPVRRAVVRAFSVDKMRPICPVCNPDGEQPYPGHLGHDHHGGSNNSLDQLLMATHAALHSKDEKS